MPGPVSAKLICQSSPAARRETVSVPPSLHGAHRVLAEIPEHLLELVAVGQCDSASRTSKSPLDADAGIFGCRRCSSSVSVSSSSGIRSTSSKSILLAARVGQEIGDDVVQPLRFAGHDLQQLALFVGQVGHAGKHADRTGNRGQRIADLVGDGGRQPADRRQTVLHAHFALQAADFGQIVEGVDVAQRCRDPGTVSAETDHTECLAKAVGRGEADFAVRALRSDDAAGDRERAGDRVARSVQLPSAPATFCAAGLTSVMRPSRPVVIRPPLIDWMMFSCSACRFSQCAARVASAARRPGAAWQPAGRPGRRPRGRRTG